MQFYWKLPQTAVSGSIPYLLCSSSALAGSPLQNAEIARIKKAEELEIFLDFIVEGDYLCIPYQ